MLLILGLLLSFYVVIIIAMIVCVIYFLVNYIFEALFLSHFVKCVDYPVFLPWIPFANKLILGRMAKKETLGIILMILDLIICIITVALFFIDSLWWVELLLFMVNFIMNTYLAYQVMKEYHVKYSDVFTVINVLTLGFSRALILFLNHNQMIMENNCSTYVKSI